MSFTDLLRNARSSRVSTVHKFLTHYDPNSERVFAFVEGDADEVFYRAQIQKYVPDQRQIYVYNCDGKKGVCNAYEDITARYPTCHRVLFFLDKDLDDIVSATWPSDPRIFTTEFYSIENYIVNKDALQRYFKDFVKVRRIEIELETILVNFDDGLRTFQRLMLPVMAWIVVAKRSGARVHLQDINPGEMFHVTAERTSRKPKRGATAYLCRVCQAGAHIVLWPMLRRAATELSRLPAKAYIRGKFEAWWFVEFGQRVLEALKHVVEEGGGSIRVSAQLHPNTFIQLLAAGVPTPAPLEKFLSFHTRRRPAATTDFTPHTRGFLQRIIDVIKGE
jgi:hypothetical protein